MKAAGLRLLVLELSDRCDQKCLHCGIWSVPGRAGMNLDERLKVVDDAAAAGATSALLTGGEPLLSPDLFPVAERLKEHGLKVLLATNGRRLFEHAASIARWIDEVYVSLDGDGPTHDRLRGVASYGRMAEGIAAARALGTSTRWVARSTLHAGNIEGFTATVEAARRLGVDHVSFLPLDASSGAFGADPAARHPLRPSATQVEGFLAVVARWPGLEDGFVLESREKLRRLARHLEAGAGRGAFERPPCDAPAWSSVVTMDGAVRPCFFHAPVGDARQGIGAIREGGGYARALRVIGGANATCDACVCPKVGERGVLERAWSRAARLLGAGAP